MDEPPRDNFNFNLISIISILCLSLLNSKSDSYKHRHHRQEKKNRLFNNIICVIRSIHSPFGAHHALI